MLRWYVRSKAHGGVKPQLEAAKLRGSRVIYTDDERDAAIKSLRKGDGIGVLRLSCLATSKRDLRWVLMGEDARKGYEGVFRRGGYVLDHEQDVKHTDMASVESVLLATESWAKEVRGQYERKGGRPPKKRTPKRMAYIAWKDLVNYPTQDDALASEHMRGWSKSAATRSIERGGLGPRGGLTGRMPKPKKD